MIMRTAILIFLLGMSQLCLAWNVVDIGNKSSCVNLSKSVVDEQEKYLISVSENDSFCVYSFDKNSGEIELILNTEEDILQDFIRSSDNIKITFNSKSGYIFLSNERSRLGVFKWNKEQNKISLVSFFDEQQKNEKAPHAHAVSEDGRHLYFSLKQKIIIYGYENGFSKQESFNLPNANQYEGILWIGWTPDQSLLSVLTTRRILVYFRDENTGKLTYLSETSPAESPRFDNIVKGKAEPGRLLVVGEINSRKQLISYQWNAVSYQWELTGTYMRSVISPNLSYQFENKIIQFSRDPNPGSNLKKLSLYTWDNSLQDYTETRSFNFETYPTYVTFLDKFIFLRGQPKIREYFRLNKYAIDDNNDLKFVKRFDAADFGIMDKLEELLWHHEGRFFYALEGHNLAVFSYDKQSGYITRIQNINSPVNGRMKMSPNGLFLYSLDINGLNTYKISQTTGELTLVNQVEHNYGRTLAFSPDSSMLISIVSYTDGFGYINTRMGVYKPSPETGVPSLLNSYEEALGLHNPVSISINNLNNKLYVLYKNENGFDAAPTLVTFSINPDSGDINVEQAVQYPTTSIYPSTIALTDNNQYLYVDFGDGIEIFNLFDDGSIDLSAEQRTIDLAANKSISISPDQSTLRVFTHGCLYEFSIDEMGNATDENCIVNGGFYPDYSSDTLVARYSPDNKLLMLSSPKKQLFLSDLANESPTLLGSNLLSISTEHFTQDLQDKFDLSANFNIDIFHSSDGINSQLQDEKLIINIDKYSLPPGNKFITLSFFNGIRTFYRTLILNINLENTPPIPTLQSASFLTTNSSILEADLLGNDDSDDMTMFSIVNYPNNGKFSWIDRYTGRFRFIPNSDYLGEDNFTFKVENFFASSNHYTADIDIEAGKVMQANDDTISVYSGGSVELNLLANDEFTNIELDEVTLEIMASSLYGNIEKVGDSFVYRAQEYYTGVEHFSYIISTESGRIDSVANVELTITDPRPVANDDYFSTNEGEAIDVDLLSNDYDLNDVVSPSNIIIKSSSENGALSMRNSSTWRYTPANGFVGTDRFTYVLTDDMGNSSDNAQIEITVVEKETSSGGSIYYLICILLSALCLKRQLLFKNAR